MIVVKLGKPMPVQPVFTSPHSYTFIEGLRLVRTEAIFMEKFEVFGKLIEYNGFLSEV